MIVIDRDKKAVNISIDELQERNKKLYNDLKQKVQFNKGHIATYNTIARHPKRRANGFINLFTCIQLGLFLALVIIVCSAL